METPVITEALVAAELTVRRMLSVVRSIERSLEDTLEMLARVTREQEIKR